MSALKQIGTRVVIRAVSRPDRDGDYVGKTGEITKFEKHKIKGTLCYLRLDDGDVFCSLKDNIDVVPNAVLSDKPPH